MSEPDGQADRALFRDEALAHQRAGAVQGRAILPPPAFLRYAFPALVVAFVLAAGALVQGKTGAYAEGVAVRRPATSPLDHRAHLLALFPVEAAAAIRPGTRLRAIGVHPRPFAEGAIVVEVGATPLAPSEARRQLGGEVGVEVAEALPLPGPVVLVRARVDGEAGVAGPSEGPPSHEVLRAEAMVGQEPLLAALVPALAPLWHAPR